MYVQLDENFFDHPKTMHLIGLVGPDGDLYPLRLWTWALKFAKEGVLKHPDMVEVACRWRGAKGLLHKAMVEAGFIEADGVTLHGWMDRTGHGLQRYEEKKARERSRYRNSASILQNSAASLPEERRVDKSRVDKSKGEESTETAAPSWVGFLLQAAKQAKIAARQDTLRSYIEAWAARSDPGRVEQILMDPWSKGKTVLEIQDHFFNGNGDGMTWDEIIKGAKR